MVFLQRAEHVPDHVPREDPLRRGAPPLRQRDVLPDGGRGDGALRVPRGIRGANRVLRAQVRDGHALRRGHQPLRLRDVQQRV